jgi:signal transduction histidine kinase
MNEDDAWWKFVLIYLAWLLAAAGIALVLALLIGQIITFFGIDAGSTTRQRVTEVSAVVFFLILAVTPFLVSRFSRGGEG